MNLNTSMIELFNGTYNTIWEVIETDDDGNELEVDYDFKNLMQSILEAYQEGETQIVKDLEVNFIKSIHFTGFWSPREYNFATDQLDFTLEIDRELMLKELAKLIDSKDFKQFLKDNYSSYDGSMSFTPNNYQEISEEIIDNGENGKYSDQAISALINFIRPENNSIDMDAYEYWSSNGYMGLDYKIVNRAEKLEARLKGLK